jgi:hypothetical protein
VVVGNLYSDSNSNNRDNDDTATISSKLHVLPGVSSTLASQIAQLITDQKLAKQQARSLRAQLKVAKRRCARLRKRTSMLSVTDLQQILRDREAAEVATGAAGNSSSDSTATAAAGNSSSDSTATASAGNSSSDSTAAASARNSSSGSRTVLAEAALDAEMAD